MAAMNGSQSHWIRKWAAVILLLWLIGSAIVAGLVALLVTAIAVAYQPLPTHSVSGRVTVDWSAMPSEIVGREPHQLQSAARWLIAPPVNGGVLQQALAEGVYERLGTDAALISTVDININATSEVHRTVFVVDVQGHDVATIVRIRDAYAQEIGSRFRDIQFLESLGETYATARDPQRSRWSEAGVNPDMALLLEMALMFGSEPVHIDLDPPQDLAVEVGLAALVTWAIASVMLIVPLWIIGVLLWWLVRSPARAGP